MKFAALAATAATLLVAGCANVPTISYVDNTGQMDRAEFMSVLNDRVTLVSVVGSPFPGLSDDALARLLAKAMPTGFTHGGRYTADPSEASGTAYRLVWDFGRTGANHGSCAVPQASMPQSALPQPVAVEGALSFCRAGGPLMRAYGFVHAAEPQAQNFRDWVTQMTLHVLLFGAPAAKGGTN